MPNPKLFNEIKLELYDGILLDLDNTVYEYEPCHIAGKEALIHFLEKHVASENYNYDWGKLYERSRSYVHKNLAGVASSHSRFLYIQGMIETALGRTDIELTMDAERVYWNHFLDKANLFSEAIDFMKRCKTSDIPICIVTDLTTEIQFRKIRHWKLSGLINYVVSSEECGHEKPHPIMFQTALTKLGMKSVEVLMIGDSQKKDIEGAENLNIRSIKI